MPTEPTYLNNITKMTTQTKDTQDKLSPNEALQMLIDGNARFIEDRKTNRNLKDQVLQTSKGQYPFAVILGCIDSRVPVEIVFDQGIGDLFSARVAGNVVNNDVLGSLEYACKVAGSMVVMVLGHTKCGAVTAACNHVELGHITGLLDKIEPAMDVLKVDDKELTDELIEEVVLENIKQSIKQIRLQSPILKEMEDNGEIKIVGANYNVDTGEIEFC